MNRDHEGEDGAFEPERALFPAVARGARGRCPRCGDAPLYRAYLKPHDACPACGLALHEHRADDLPPYLTILIAGHALIPGMLALERLAGPPLWASVALCGAAAVGLCLALLPPVKGAVIGLQWAYRMHGFDDAAAGPGGAPDHPACPDADRGWAPATPQGSDP